MPPKPNTLRSLRAAAEYSLGEGPHPERARLDAETLLLHLLQRGNTSRDKAWLLSHQSQTVMPRFKAEFESFVARRRTGEPIQYITGTTEFYGLPFQVSPGVLIPRPETEHLVEEVIRLAAQFPAPHIADIGTGSGAIAVALAHSLPNAKFTATDLSPQALNIARRNAESNALHIEFLKGDLLAPLAGRRFDMIASNPPYIPEADSASLSIEVRDHEPATALFAGADGLAIYRRLIPEAIPVLNPNAFLVMEIGFGQQPEITAILEQFRYQDIRFLPDYQGIPRVAIARRP